MLRIAIASGTSDIVATPHANSEFRYNRAAAEDSRSRLQDAIGASIRIHLGCDFHLQFDLVEDALASPETFSVNGGKYVLIELPESIPPKTVSEVCKRLAGRGLHPILTHPERYPAVRARDQQVEEWVREGILMQVTAGSLLGRFGGNARRAAEAWLNAGLVHFLASDAHDSEDRTPDLATAYSYVCDRWDEATALQLLVSNPRAVLNGASVRRVEASTRRHWFSFGR